MKKRYKCRCDEFDLPARTQRSRSSDTAEFNGAFSMLELLCVLAILGLLLALVIPSIGAARQSANRVNTKVQFAQWIAAIESFRSQYGHYPVFDPSGLVNGGVTSSRHPFHDLLSARSRDGADLAAGSDPLSQNIQRIRFHSFSPAEIGSNGYIQDARGNTEIAVLVDRDLDGVIRQGSDFNVLPAVNGLAPGTEDFPSAGVRAGVLLYAPAWPAGAANRGFILSWK